MIQESQDRPTPKPDRRSKSFDLILFLSLACFKEIGIVDETVFPKYFKLLNTFLWVVLMRLVVSLKLFCFLDEKKTF